MLLAVFNSIWESGIFPPFCREATIVAIPNPVRILQILITIDQLLVQNDGEDGEKPTEVGLGIQRFIGLGAVRF